MSYSGRCRRILEWVAIGIGVFVLALGLVWVWTGGTPADAGTGGPEGVRVQHYTDSVTGRNCLVFTHDTGQGASIAVNCG